MNTTPSEAIINNTISELEKRRAELRAELAKTERALRRFGALADPRIRWDNKDAVRTLFASNGNAWLTVRAIMDALPQCNRKSLRVSIYKYTADGYLERRPHTATPDEKRLGPATKHEYRLAEPPAT